MEKSCGIPMELLFVPLAHFLRNSQSDGNWIMNRSALREHTKRTPDLAALLAQVQRPAEEAQHLHLVYRRKCHAFGDNTPILLGVARSRSGTGAARNAGAERLGINDALNYCRIYGNRKKGSVNWEVKRKDDGRRYDCTQ